jgi:four helix bundle protein
MSEQADRLQERTMQFAVDVCALIKLLPPAEPGPTVSRQLAKCSTSVAMNYRSSRRARSHKEFTSRIGIVADEADESLGWLQFVDRASLLNSSELGRLMREATELRDIFAASYGTARYRHRTESRQPDH